MKINTIQITPQEDRQITRIKKALGLPSKKAVLTEGIRMLQQTLQDRERKTRLQAASQAVRKTSLASNREWAPMSSGGVTHED